MNNNQYKIKCNQQFTKELQTRRNAALLERRELFKEEKIVKAYIEYPATLKVLLPEAKGYTKYRVF